MAAFACTALSGTLFCLSTAPWQIMVFGALTSCFLALGSTALYTYTPELYPTEIRATGMGIASSWGRVGTISLLLVFGSQYTGSRKLLLFVLSDVLLVVGAVAVLILGPSTRGKSLEEAARDEDSEIVRATSTDEERLRDVALASRSRTARRGVVHANES